MMCRFAHKALDQAMDKWTEIKTAYQVARLGTVSAAADALGVHRATVLRHIDALEAEFGEKLFQRHARGYEPTEAGFDLMRVAQTTDEQFSQLFLRTRGRAAELSGDFIVTSLEIASPLLMPALSEFQLRHPKVTVRYLISSKLFRLEYGEAHIALRTGAKPEQPDNIVRLFSSYQLGLYAHQGYIARQGKPVSVADFADHTFIGFDNLNSPAPFEHWMHQHVPVDNIVFRSNSQPVMQRALLGGIGIGFMSTQDAEQHPELVKVDIPEAGWEVNHWLVTHSSLHRTAKVQAFLEILRESE
ncbi:MAG: LysR family transcriptional regulator [Thiolinea sp.]